MLTVTKTPKKNPTTCSSRMKLEGCCHQYPHIPMSSVLPVTYLPSTPDLACSDLSSVTCCPRSFLVQSPTSRRPRVAAGMTLIRIALGEKESVPRTIAHTFD